MADGDDETTEARYSRRLERLEERFEGKLDKLSTRLEAAEKAADGRSQLHETAREVVRLLVAILAAGGVSWLSAGASRTAEHQAPAAVVAPAP